MQIYLRPAQANDRMPPSRPTVREAVPRPPLTMARPRKPVLTSTAVFPDATLCINQLMSDAVRSRTSRDPNSGRMWRVIRPRSTYSVEAFFGLLRLPKTNPFSAASR